jgi:DNA-binding transcriptional MerR regulator
MTVDRPLRPGELARLTGVSTDTLRHYERKGLLPRPPRTRNGYRAYPPAALERVQVIRKALAIGFSIRELGEILAARDRGGAPCRRVRTLAAAKIQSLDERIVEMQELREALARTVDDWDARLAGLKPGQRAGLLYSLGKKDTT